MLNTISYIMCFHIKSKEPLKNSRKAGTSCIQYSHVCMDVFCMKMLHCLSCEVCTLFLNMNSYIQFQISAALLLSSIYKSKKTK